MSEEKERITILSKKDLEITWFSGGPGAGGQYRNKHNNCCRIKHPESGAQAQATEQRSQEQNKKLAFRRLLEHPKMKVWISNKLFEIRGGESLEKRINKEIDKQMAPENLLIENYIPNE